MFAFAFVPDKRFLPKTWTFDEIKASAEESFRHAGQIVESMAIARQYAEDWYEAYQPSYYINTNPVAQAQMITRRAAEVMRVAKAIVADGRPWYIHKDGGRDHLVICWLHDEENETRHSGYVLWAEMRKAA